MLLKELLMFSWGSSSDFATTWVAAIRRWRDIWEHSSSRTYTCLCMHINTPITKNLYFDWLYVLFHVHELKNNSKIEFMNLYAKKEGNIYSYLNTKIYEDILSLERFIEDWNTPSFKFTSRYGGGAWIDVRIHLSVQLRAVFTICFAHWTTRLGYVYHKKYV